MTTIPSVMYMKNGMKNLVINYDFSCRSVVFCSEKKINVRAHTENK